jgi:hypothetical protein
MRQQKATCLQVAWAVRGLMSVPRMRLHGGAASGIVAICAASAGAGWATQPMSLSALADVILAAFEAPTPLWGATKDAACSPAVLDASVSISSISIERTCIPRRAERRLFAHAHCVNLGRANRCAAGFLFACRSRCPT